MTEDKDNFNQVIIVEFVKKLLIITIEKLEIIVK